LLRNPIEQAVNPQSASQFPFGWPAPPLLPWPSSCSDSMATLITCRDDNKQYQDKPSSASFHQSVAGLTRKLSGSEPIQAVNPCKKPTRQLIVCREKLPLVLALLLSGRGADAHGEHHGRSEKCLCFQFNDGAYRGHWDRRVNAGDGRNHNCRAAALPSFARQTGLACGGCHTEFPQLTPFGRRFKLNGYTLGWNNKPLGSPGWLPPVSAQTIFTFTHTQTSQDNAGSISSLGPNDNPEFQSASLFYGGAITEHIGLFAQGTYNAPGFGPPAAHQYTWDNLDLRYADHLTIAGLPIIYGITMNNNPTVQDVWNSTPAWGYPFVSSNLAPTPAAKTLIDQGFAAHVLGAGAYMFINDMLYLEAAGYETLDPSAQNSLGTDPMNTPLTNRVMPYFRVAIEPHWGKHSWEIGAFGMFADTNLPPATPGPGTNQFSDIGFDSQYQYQGDGYWITLRATYIHEDQQLNASVANGLAANLTNQVNTFRAQAALSYGVDGKVILTGGYFNIWGSSDQILYSGNSTFSPNSDGFIAEIAYQLFGKHNAPEVWPWFNARIGLQYITYNKFNGASMNFDGNGRNASDNNTLLLYAWLAF
jgi:hypothetical protein